MSETHLTGLEGTNPLGFLAALGVQVAFASKQEQPSLWWSDSVTPHAIIDGNFTIGRIIGQIMDTISQWKDSPAVTPKLSDDSAMPKGDELKLSPDNMRLYLDQASQSYPAGGLITALVAEGSLDKQGVAKPSDLYFTAGQQKFLYMVRQILSNTSQDDVRIGLEGPWNYASRLPSLGWDVVDDRLYAMRAQDPSSEAKLTNPGSESMAVLGLSMHPVFAGRNRTLTQGCSGLWSKSKYSWPLWGKPASPRAVKSLLAHAYDPSPADRYRWLRSWGVFKILRSSIRRSGQGGYGTFGPPEVAWQLR